MAVKCANCGSENPETEAFCRSCGREISSANTRNCVSCGRSISWSALVCPYCGKDYRVQAFAPAQQQLISTGMKILLYIASFLIPIVGFIIGAIYYTKPEQEYKHVGKICIVLGIVAFVVTLGLSALLYVMVLGFGGINDGMTPAISVLRRMSVSGGFDIAFTAPTSQVVWSDVMFELTDGTGTVIWNPTTQDLTSTSSITHSYGTRVGLIGIDVHLNVTDLTGNGWISNGDHITLTATDGSFSTVTTYTLTMIYEPTGEAMLMYPFSG